MFTAVFLKQAKDDSQGWVCCACREAAGNDDLKGSLQNPISNIMGLRANGYKGLQPNPYFGNAVSLVVIQPPSTTPESQIGGSDLGELLAAAACAVRLTTQMFRADVAGSAKQLMAALPALVSAECLRNADMNPFKGCCVDVVSWRNMYNDVDFGQGRPALTLGAAMPTLTNISWIIEAPDGDGVYCTIWFLQQQFDRLQDNQLLQRLVPEASFVKASSK